MIARILLTFLLTTSFAAFQVPTNDGFVTDTAGVLTPEQDTTLEQRLMDYQKQTSNEVAILIVPTLAGEPIADAAVAIGRAWGVGDEKKNNGIIILIARDDRQLFLATGYGLEGSVPDIVARGIVEQEILPHFRDGNYYDGIVAGLDALEMHIAGEYTADRYTKKEESGGFIPGLVLFFGFILLQWLAAIMARTKSWWLGGVVGGVLGLVLAFLVSWWITIPFFVLFGLALDYAVSRNYKSRSKTKWWAGGGWGPGGGGSGSGGFGGFSGGSFGGGGSGGSW